MEKNTLKRLIHNFLHDELKEIRENKVRVITIILFSLLAISSIFVDIEDETIGFDEPVQTENVRQEKNFSKNNKKLSDDEVIPIKTVTTMSDANKNISVVVGANSDDLIISNPFVSVENEENISQDLNVIQQIPMIPASYPDISFEMPSSYHQNPTIPEKSQITEEVFLTGVIVGEEKKAGLIRKVSSLEDKILHEEYIAVEVGDYLQGQQIVDITENFLVFDKDDLILPFVSFGTWSKKLDYENSGLEKIDGNSFDDLDIEKNFDESTILETPLQNYRNDFDVPTKVEETLPETKSSINEFTVNELADAYLQQEEMLVDDDKKNIHSEIRNEETLIDNVNAGLGK